MHPVGTTQMYRAATVDKYAVCAAEMHGSTSVTGATLDVVEVELAVDAGAGGWLGAAPIVSGREEGR